jgi:hypothetical protein
MRVPTTISPGPRSTDLEQLDQEVESHPIWTELRGPVTDHAGRGGESAAGGRVIIDGELVMRPDDVVPGALIFARNQG